MRVVRSFKNRSVFHLGQREKQLLLALLKLYPCVPSAHHSITKSALLRDHESIQRLLDEALAEQRAENKRQLRALLADSRRFRRTKTGWLLSLLRSEAEWLLQILNDIRIGSWITLGSPEAGVELAVLNAKAVPHFWAMEMSGHFQMQLLEALEGER